MAKRRCVVVGLFLALATASGCGGSDAADHSTDAAVSMGTPRITQVYLTERYESMGAERTRTALAFGEDARVGDDGDGAVAEALPYDNDVWIVFDRVIGGAAGADGLVRIEAVGLDCDGTAALFDDAASRYYSADGYLVTEGVTTLGPSISLRRTRFPTGARCKLVLVGVTSSDGMPACAPAGGQPNGSCDAGDLSAIDFGVVPLVAEQTAPADQQVDVDRFGNILIKFNAHIDPTTLDAISLKAGDVIIPTDDRALEEDATVAVLDPTDVLAANTVHELSIPVDDDAPVQDVLGGPLSEARTVTFTTAP